MKKLSFFFLLLPLLGGCATTGTVADFSELTIQVAEYRIFQAGQEGGLWLNTESLLDQARQRHSAGDFQKALELARQARFESEAAHAQNLTQKNARPWQF